MSGDLEIALAFVAKREAKRSMTASRWAHLLSLELGWMNPGQARAFVERAQKAGLLGQEEDKLRLVIDPAGIEIPRGFRPNINADAAPRATEPEDPFLTWVAKLCVHAQVPREQILERVAATQARFGGMLTADAAILLLAAESGLDARQAAQQAAADLRVKGQIQTA